MLNWDIDSVSKMQDELLKKAEQDHLAQEVIEETRKQNPHYNPTLAWVGRRILEVGTKLVQMSGSDADKQSLRKPDIYAN